MLAALLTTFLFAASAISGHRVATRLGGIEANFWRILLATAFLALWANLFGSGTSGSAFLIFFISGLFGVGLGDSGYFQALPRLGSRRTVLLTQCLTAPFAAFIEWIWLGTKLNVPEILCIGVILAGVAIALAPSDHAVIPSHQFKIGVAATIVAAFGGALGAVISRKAYAVAAAAGEHPDPGTAGYQRVLGGVIVPVVIFILFKWKTIGGRTGSVTADVAGVRPASRVGLWPWILANSLAGQTIGMTCFQWAVEKTPAGVVTAVVATTPIVLLIMTRVVDGDKIGSRSLAGAVVAVGGVVGLAHWH
jgi:drug/metabolite transporter (DMT)-like permease